MMNRLSDIFILHTIKAAHAPAGVESAEPEADQPLKQDSLPKE